MHIPTYSQGSMYVPQFCSIGQIHSVHRAATDARHAQGDLLSDQGSLPLRVHGVATSPTGKCLALSAHSHLLREAPGFIDLYSHIYSSVFGVLSFFKSRMFEMRRTTHEIKEVMR